MLLVGRHSSWCTANPDRVAWISSLLLRAPPTMPTHSKSFTLSIAALIDASDTIKDTGWAGGFLAERVGSISD